MNSSEPRILVIDTSDSQAIVEAWVADNRIMAESFGAARHAQALTGKIKSVLNQADWRVSDIQAIAVNLGPGSFTGIRVGLATAKALAYVHELRMIGVDCFDAIAADVPNGSKPFQIILPGQLRTYHVVSFEIAGGVRNRRPLRTLPRDELAANVNNGADALYSTQGSVDQLAGMGLTVRSAKPRAARAAVERWRAGTFDDSMLLEPFYVRPSSAEVVWDARAAKN